MASTKSSWTVAFTYDDTPLTFTGPKATSIKKDVESYTLSGIPKMLHITSEDGEDPVTERYINFKCICDLTFTRTVEDVDPRPCEDICCIPDRIPEDPDPVPTRG